MAGERYKLVIGNKNWSSWSLRPWLAMKRFGVAFEEIHIQLRREDTRGQILAFSPSGKIPALIDDGLVVWDSLAIMEYLASEHPDIPFWPKHKKARAIARSVSAEMHSGFQALRQHCPMDIVTVKPVEPTVEEVKLNAQRVIEIWKDCRRTFGGSGPFLFSEFSVADAMYAPVASRFRTYFDDLRSYGDDGTAKAYIETIFAMPEIDSWMKGAREEMQHPQP
jgi:glutathione S-transferase